jgi:hypothetical protein
MPLIWPFAAAATQVETDFEWGNPWPAWVVFLAIVLLIGFVVRTYRRETGGAGSIVRVFCGALRVLLVLAVLVLIWEPQLVTRSEEEELSTVAVLADRSRSMSLTDRYAGLDWAEDLARFLDLPSVVELQETQRVDIAREFARRLGERYRELGTHRLVWYAFDSSVTPEVLPEAYVAEGSETHLGSAIDAVVQDLTGELRTAIIVLTDGQSNGGKRTPEEASASLAPPDGILLYTVGIGDPTPPRDLWVTSLQAPERALVEDTVVFDFVVGNYGFEQEGARVELRIARADAEHPEEEARLEDHAAVTLGDERERVKLQLRYRFDDPGEYLCYVRVEEKPGEIETRNNVQVHHITVLDRRIKVLYVEGYPRWEYRYLKSAMIRDPSLEVYCLLQSADEGFPQEVTPGFQRLREFPPGPADETQEDPLFDFDVIILGDVEIATRTHRVSLDAEARERIVTFVEHVGGGLVLISGAIHNPVEYDADAHLRKLLPIVVDARLAEEAKRDRVYSDPFRIRLTPEGLVNPMLRLKEDQEENRRFIEMPQRQSLPGFYWYFPVENARPAALVLATHDRARNAVGRRLPIFVLQQVGKGKVFWSATDETWRWRRLIGDRYVYRLWGQVIRGLAQGKLLGGTQRVSIFTSKPEYTYGEQVEITAEVLGRNYEPVGYDEVPEVQVTLAPLSRPEAAEELVLPPRAEPGGGAKEGLYSGLVIPRVTGSFRITVKPSPDLELGEGPPPEAIFHVREPAVEMENPYMNQELLEQCAAASGKAIGETQHRGSFFLPHELDELVDALPAERKTIPSETTPPVRLWHPDRWRWLLILLGAYTAILTVEWITRKLNRML